MKRRFTYFLLTFFICFFATAQPTSEQLKTIDKEANNIPNTSSFNGYKSSFNELKSETTIHYSKNKSYTVLGKWALVERKVFSIDHYVSHCPMFYNESGVIMEFAIRDKNFTTKKFKNSSDKLTNMKSEFEDKKTDTSERYQLIKQDSLQNYALYKKKDLNIVTDQNLDVYYLIGVKALKEFRIAIFNFKETDYENMEDFIIQCYTMNR